MLDDHIAPLALAEKMNFLDHLDKILHLLDPISDQPMELLF
jgi:hypothetical protein